MALRARNAEWLRRWEAIPPDRRMPARLGGFAFLAYLQAMRAEQRAGRALSLAIDLDGRLVGQVMVTSIQRGAALTGTVGYWVDERVAGQGIAPTAVAMVVDHCFLELGLHRVEVDVQPGNEPSRRVVDKLGFRCEGVRRGLLHVDGQWRDHELWAMTIDEAAGGVSARYRRLRASRG